MTPGERDLLWLLKAWLAHRRSGWTHRHASFDCLCKFVVLAERVFVGLGKSQAGKARRELEILLFRDFGTDHRPFKAWDGHDNPARVAWVRKIIKELEGKQ